MDPKNPFFKETKKVQVQKERIRNVCSLLLKKVIEKKDKEIHIKIAQNII